MLRRRLGLSAAGHRAQEPRRSLGERPSRVSAAHSLSEDITGELALTLLCASEKTKPGLSRGQNLWE